MSRGTRCAIRFLIAINAGQRHYAAALVFVLRS